MDPDQITYFAETDSRGKRVPFGIKARDRSKHVYVIGKTGMGKSTLLENMAIQDIRNGNGIAFIDPHGSSAEKLLEYVPEERAKDVLYFAPFDLEHPIAFNVMEDVGYDKRHLVVSGLMSAFKKIWVDAWSARMEYILSNVLLALLEYPDSTLLDVNRMLVEKAYRKKVVEYVTDPIVKSFWVDEFANYTDRYTQDATPAIQNKVGQFTSNPLIRNIVGQAKSSFDLREMMDTKKILIVNLSKGRMGETNASLLGSMLTTKIYLAAMSRADLPAKEIAKLPDFYFYVDEFQSVANDSFADILSEARKYKLAITLAHQYIEQMEENVRDAVLGNVGTTIVFRVGPLDSELFEKVFAPQFTAEDLVNLGRYQMYITLSIDGVGSPPFSATTLPLIEPPSVSHSDRIIAFSRERFGRPRAIVEEVVRKQHQPEIGFAERDGVGKKPVRRAASPARVAPVPPTLAATPNISPLPTPTVPVSSSGAVVPARAVPPLNSSTAARPEMSAKPVQRFAPTVPAQNSPQSRVPHMRPPRQPDRAAASPAQKPISLSSLKAVGKQSVVSTGRSSKGPTPESRSALKEALAAAMKNGAAAEKKSEAGPVNSPTLKQSPTPPRGASPREVPEDVLKKLLGS